MPWRHHPKRDESTKLHSPELGRFNLQTSTMSLLNSLFGVNEEEVAVNASNRDLFETVVDIPQPAAKQQSGSLPDSNNADAPVVTYGPAERPATDTVNNKDDDARTIFVGNLPASFVTRKRKLAALFDDCGTIACTRFRSVATAGVKLPAEQKGNQDLVRKVSVNTQQLDTSVKQSVSAYVVFADPASVELALEKNNMEVRDDTTNTVRHLRVDRVEPTYNPAQTVFVGNLPYGADEESLASYFRGLQRLPVRSVRIVRDKDTHKCKGFGYVLFEDRASVAKALQHPDDKTNYMGRRLRVQVCGKRYKSQHHNANDTTTTTTTTTPPPRQQQRDRATTTTTAVGAVRRVLAKQQGDTTTGGGKKKRARRSDKGKAHKAGGMSKRAASEAKVNKRIQKIEKRIAKGMGKGRKA